MNMNTIDRATPAVKPSSIISRARRHAAKQGMRMIKQRDRGYKPTRLIHLRGKHQDSTVAEGLTPRSIIDLCECYEEITSRIHWMAVEDQSLSPDERYLRQPSAVEEPLVLPAQTGPVN